MYQQHKAVNICIYKPKMIIRQYRNLHVFHTATSSTWLRYYHRCSLILFYEFSSVYASGDMCPDRAIHNTAPDLLEYIDEEAALEHVVRYINILRDLAHFRYNVMGEEEKKLRLVFLITTMSPVSSGVTPVLFARVHLSPYKRIP